MPVLSMKSYLIPLQYLIDPSNVFGNIFRLSNVCLVTSLDCDIFRLMTSFDSDVSLVTSLDCEMCAWRHI